MTIPAAMELALQKHQAGQFAEAEAIYRKVLAVAPDQADALNLLGLILQQRGQLNEAARLIGRAIQVAPATGEYHYNIGVVLAAQNRHDLAVAAFRHALTLRPQDVFIRHHIGASLQAAGRLTEALAEFRKGVELMPRDAPLIGALATVLAELGQWSEAIERNRQSLVLDPSAAATHLNLGVLLLREGEYEAAWPEYEWRWRVKNLEVGPITSHQPVWNGGDLAGQRILLHTEQGFGDAIQMIRYAPMVRARGGRTVVFCQTELERLFQSAEGIDEILTWKVLPPPCEEHSPLMSLPGAFKTTLETIPSPAPYLHADPELSRRWRERIGEERRLKIGLAWAGQPGHLKDRQRSLPLSRLEFLGSIPNVRLFSLQKGKPAQQIRGAKFELTDWTEDLTDFAETAALADNLDLVITIDSAVAHLCGAIGKKTWVLLPVVSDWRWLRGRTDSPWYPAMRLFRQTTIDDWQPPLNELAAAVRAL